MLHELTIENFALLAHVHIRFGAGLNVLTGETGAGKSIIIDAISRVLGSRGGADDVRTGAAHAHIEAVFSLAEPPAALHTLLAERGLLDADDDGPAPDTGPLEIILTRDIRPNGRSIGRVNGRAVPLHTVAALGRFLLDIHGQTEHLSLLQPATQLQLLDRFGGLEALGAEIRDTAAALGDARRQWRAMQQDERELARRVD
ncbi:MAG: AAA family ATPase, partial [Chloroflexota bacterium]|nr:AAA family ATPase [Chloroflexota bacterium]